MMIGVCNFWTDAAQLENLCTIAKLASEARHFALDIAIERYPKNYKIEVP